MSDGATNDSEESDSANGSGRSGEPSLSADPIPESGAMLGLILRFLSGSESAMAALAVHPWSLRVGLAFVLLAGVAREYDGEDLLGEPWHLLVPLVASLVSCTLLFLLLNFGAWRKGVAREDRPGYLAFLRLFWLTAPLALVYAIPFERVLPPVAAAHANMALLLIVATWRVWLMIRVTRVLFGASRFAATSLVLFYGGVLLFFALQFSPVPIIHVMGGLRLSPAERAIQWWMQNIFLLTFFGLPLMALLAVVCLARGPVGGIPAWQPSVSLAELRQFTPGELPWPRDAFTVAGVALLALLPMIPGAQAEQRVRRRIETAMLAGEVESGLADLRKVGRAALPPNWVPPRPTWDRKARRWALSRPELFRALKPEDQWLWLHYAEQWERELEDPTRRDEVRGGVASLPGESAEPVLSEAERLAITKPIMEIVPLRQALRYIEALASFELPEAKRFADEWVSEAPSDRPGKRRKP